MKSLEKASFFFGICILFAIVCTGCAKKYPACNDYHRYQSFDKLRIKKGSTIQISMFTKSPELEKKLIENIARMGLVPINNFNYSLSGKINRVTKEHIKGKKLSKREKFLIYKENDALDTRADYYLSFTTTDWGSDDIELAVVIRETTPDAKTLTDWQYFEYDCHRKKNVYHQRFPIACPIGSEKDNELCKPFAATKVIQILKEHITY